MKLLDFTKEHISKASALAMENYEEERRAVPALPPVKWVRMVEMKMSGAIFRGMFSPEWMADSTRLVPESVSLRSTW